MAVSDIRGLKLAGESREFQGLGTKQQLKPLGGRYWSQEYLVKIKLNQPWNKIRSTRDKTQFGFSQDMYR